MASVQVTAVNSYGFLGYAVILSIISVFAVDGSSENIFSQGFHLTNGIFIYFPHGYGIGTCVGWFAEYNLLTAKPVIYAANVAEEDLANDGADNAQVASVREFAAKENSEVFVICAQIEQEIAELDEDEKKMFLEDLGLKESGLEKLIRASYRLLGLISYLTTGPDETRAWTITEGTKAPQAAGKIHTDFERGFIRAEVVSYDNLVKYDGMNGAKEKGLVRSEGKDYVVQDGDVVLFRFNV